LGPPQAPVGIAKIQSPEVVLDRPSIAVLLFANLTPNHDNQYLVTGLTVDLITDLSMSSEFFVIARDSSFSSKDGQQNLPEVASKLGARYVIVGSVQQNDRGFRVSAQLIKQKQAYSSLPAGMIVNMLS
jgi:adenylate cyclase